MPLHHRIQTSKAWIDPTWLNSKWMENDCMVCQGAAIMAWQTYDFYEDLCLYSTSFQFMCSSCGYRTWKIKILLQNDFSSKLKKKNIDFSVYHFRVFSFQLKNCALFKAQKPTSWYSGSLLHYIDNYQLSKWLLHAPPERDGSRKKLGICVVGMYKGWIL